MKITQLDNAFLDFSKKTVYKCYYKVLRNGNIKVPTFKYFNVLVGKSTVTETEKFALLFEFDGDVKAIRHVLYNCSASRPSIESETKEDTIEPGTKTLSLTEDPREDGLVKSRTGDTTGDSAYQNWYKTVYVPVAKASTPSSNARQ